MMLPHDVTDHAEAKRPDSTEPHRPGGILLFGYLRKLKVNYHSLIVLYIVRLIYLFTKIFVWTFAANEEKILHFNS